MMTSWDMNLGFLKYMEQIKFENESLFEGVSEIEQNYGVSRSFRRGANTRAKEEGVPEELRKFINRWSSFESKRGNRPNMSMAEHYVEAKLIMKRTPVYSRLL